MNTYTSILYTTKFVMEKSVRLRAAPYIFSFNMFSIHVTFHSEELKHTNSKHI